MMQTEFDIVIVGGGLVGLSLANALAPLPLRVAVLEANALSAPTQPTKTMRSIALNEGSRRILDTLTLWSELETQVTPIKKIHVSHQGRFGATRMRASEAGVPALGYVIAADKLIAPIADAVRSRTHTTVFSPVQLKAITKTQQGFTLTLEGENTSTLKTTMLVAADGAKSKVRELRQVPVKRQAYGQTAIVSDITISKPHAETAYERFTKQGPLALLPLQGRRCGLVWAVPDAYLAEVKALSDAAFLKALQKNFGHRLGVLNAASERVSFPLALSVTEDIADAGLFFIGNAAQSLHPIAAQGFNLGLRDVAMLAQVIRDAVQTQCPLNAMRLAKAYREKRQKDRRETIRLTDFLPRVFQYDFAPLSLARDLGLCAVDRISPLKNVLMQHSLGLAGQASELASGIALTD